MRFRFWGVRGTFPVSDRRMLEFGGHTPCASLGFPGKEVLVVDAGTGIKHLGDRLEKERREQPLTIHLLLTHFHLDHIQGLPFFSPLFSSSVSVCFYTDCPAAEAEVALGGLMGSRYFPVSFAETTSRKTFLRVPAEGCEIGRWRVFSSPLVHPQGSVAYRIDGNGKSIVFATDTEHPEQGIDERLASFAAGADILVYDATFTPAEYEEGKKGLGHSTWLEGTRLAREAGVGKLFLSHFNPLHTDAEVGEILRRARDVFPETYAAKEGEG